MIKDILVNLATGIKKDTTIDYAVSLAGFFNAHLAGVAFAYDTIPPAMLAGEVPQAWIEALHKEAQDAARAAVGKFEETARHAGISAQASWLPASLAGPAELFGRMARRFDLSVVRQAEPGKSTPAPLVIEAALFETGRPALVVPYIQKTGIKLERAMVCWDGSRSAARAAGDAMPFLQRAKTVEVAIGRHGKSDETPGGYRPASCPPWRHDRGQADRRARCQDSGCPAVARSRHVGGLSGAGRLRPFAIARIRAWRRHTQHSRHDDGPHADVALSASSGRRPSWPKVAHARIETLQSQAAASVAKGELTQHDPGHSIRSGAPSRAAARQAAIGHRDRP